MRAAFGVAVVAVGVLNASSVRAEAREDPLLDEYAAADRLRLVGKGITIGGFGLMGGAAVTYMSGLVWEMKACDLPAACHADGVFVAAGVMAIVGLTQVLAGGPIWATGAARRDDAWARDQSRPRMSSQGFAVAF